MRRIPWQLLAASGWTAILLDVPFPLAGPLQPWRAIFAWFALVPLMVGLLRLPGERPELNRRRILGWSFLAGWLCGALWFGANCYWVYDTMHLYGGMSPGLAALSLVLFSLYLGFWFGVFALALAIVHMAFRRGELSWVALAAAPFLWTAMEFALARIPEFPWDLLGYSQVDNGLLTRLAPWTGVYGISFVVAAINAGLAAGSLAAGSIAAGSRAAESDAAASIGARSIPVGRLRVDLLTWRYLGLVAVLIAFVLSAGVLFAPPKPDATATAVLVQPNLDVAKDDVWVGPEWDRRLAQYGKLSAEACNHSFIAGIPETNAPTIRTLCAGNASPPAVIVWPESPAPFRDADDRFRTAIAGIAQANHAPMIVGDVGIDADAANQQFDIFNSASVVAADGHFTGRYDKMHLVPFGEYVPLRKAFFFVHKLTEQLGDTSVGQSRKVFTLNGHRYGAFICYESVFGDEVRHFALNGAEVLVNISDDGWYGDTSAPWQHLNMARMRAIENRRWILRDTNNGATVAIDSYGTVRQSLPRHNVDALAAGFAYGSELTWYTRHGDVFAWICAFAALGITGWAGRSLLFR